MPRIMELNLLVFQDKIATMYDKILRMTISGSVVGFYLNISLEIFIRCVSICKSDLILEITIEFPELIGIISEYYAINNYEN